MRFLPHSGMAPIVVAFGAVDGGPVDQVGGCTRPVAVARRGRRASCLSVVMTSLVALLLVAAPDAVAASAPSVSLNPTSGPPGTQVTVSGENWPPGDSVAIAFPDRGFWGPGSTTVGQDGSFTYSFAWPSPAAPGDYQVAVIDNTGPVDGPPYPVFTVTSTGSPGSKSSNRLPVVTVDRAYVANANWSEATQFSPGDIVRYQIVISASGDAVVNAQMQVVSSDGRSIFNSGGDTAVSPRAGSIFFQSAIPSDVQPGTYIEQATVTYNGVITTRTSTFSVSTPGGSQPGGAESQPGGSGSGSGSQPGSSGSQPGGSGTVPGSDPPIRPSPSISLSRSSGPAGTAVTVTGSGYTANESISVLLRPPGTQVTTSTSDASGSFTADFALPPDATPGPTDVVAADATGDETADASFEVAAPSLTRTTFKNPAWAGIGLLQDGVTYQKVTGRWKEPAVDCSGAIPFMSTVSIWVGLGGLGTGLEQVGSIATCEWGTAHHQGVLEIVAGSNSKAERLADDVFAIAEGDDIEATVAAGSGSNYSLSLINHTTGQAVTEQREQPSNAGAQGSAECVVERPVSPGGLSLIVQNSMQYPLPNFNSVQFAQCAVEGRDAASGRVVRGTSVLKFEPTQTSIFTGERVLAESSWPCVGPENALTFSVTWKEGGTMRNYFTMPGDIGQPEAATMDSC